jgi:hypothetical protein
VDPKTIEAMKDFPCPKMINFLHGFLSLMGYYRKFVQKYGKIAASLTVILKMNASSWTPLFDQSFHALKEAKCTTLVLAVPDFTKTFVLECDASGKGIGVLMQDGGPLMDFTNKQLL